MPKSAFKNPFGRRRSAGNALDFASPSESPEPASSSTFRVIERADKNTQHNFDGAERKITPARTQPTRPFDSPLQQLRGKSVEELGSTNRYGLSQREPLKNPRLINQRGSRGTTNSGSSGYYDSSGASARYSSTSTLPSSLEPEREPEEEEDLFSKKRATAPMFSSSNNPALAPHPLPQPPSFASRASRALSFGLKGKTPPPGLDDVPPLPTELVDRTASRTSPTRDRAMTASSYASTAVPPKTDAPLDLPAADFGNDFGGMFDTFNDRRPSRGSPTPPALGGFRHNESPQPTYPPRSYSRQGALPSPNEQRNIRASTASPYSLEGRRSNDGLVGNSTFSSPTAEDGPGLPAIAPAFLGGSKQGYALVGEQAASPGAERLSFESHNSQREFMTGASKTDEPAFTSRQTHLDDGDRWANKNSTKVLAPSASNLTQQTASSSSTARQKPAKTSTSNNSRVRANSHQKNGSIDWQNESRNATPKAARFSPAQEQSLFDETSPVGPPSRAMRPSQYALQNADSGTPKKMTKAQFEMLQKGGNNSVEQSEDESLSGDEYDDEDEEERAKQATKQRRKQEANMSVYRQQMKKVTGGGPSDLPSRPNLDRSSQSAPGLYLGGIGGAPPPDAIRGKQSDDDDDEVPLGILQAHGFPSGSRPPTQTGMGGDFAQRASVAGSVAGGNGGNLPAFARRLPQDPYFGAGLVNPSNRESLAYGGGGGGSVYGGPTTPMGNPMTTPGGHPGGLVGVIAGEERAKAARRATPSAAYGTTPLPSNMPAPMPRTMSMGNIPPPSMYGGQVPPMPQMPQMPMMMPGQDPNQQMQQFMQMQMQFMQNMMAMQQQQQGMGQMQPPQQQPMNGYLSPGPSRLMSMASQAPPNQGRSMTMMGPPSTWGQNQQGGRPTSTFQQYTPSVHNLQAGPGAGYTPSIAPSERSNIGMPSRYRPVSTMNGDSAMMSGGRSQSMTSSHTLQAFQNQQQNAQQPDQQQKNTVRAYDKPKGAPRISSRLVDPEEDEDQGWSEMAKKRSERKWKWGRSKKEKEEPLGDLYQNVE